MRRYFVYFKHLLKHKWYVMKTGKKISCPLWLSIIRD
jgi:hypothetical protein